MKPWFPAGTAVAGFLLVVLSSRQGWDLGVWVDEEGVSLPFSLAPLLGIAAIGVLLFLSGFVATVTALVRLRDAAGR